MSYVIFVTNDLTDLPAPRLWRFLQLERHSLPKWNYATTFTLARLKTSYHE